MPDSQPSLDRPRSQWIRLQTLVRLRWVAIVGQIAAIFVSSAILHLEFELGLISLVIGASIIANLLSAFLIPESRKLSERAALLILFLDLLQLVLLLSLTGGLHNPFSLLVLVPVTIAATFMSLGATVVLMIAAIVGLSILANWYLPLGLDDGRTIMLPRIFLFGFWLALTIGVVFLGIYARRVTSEMHSMSDALLATQMALAREQKLTDLGGVVAAAAHELGTPLATIKLVSGELASELSDHPELAEDIALISEQTDRCRDILRSMGQAGKEDKHLRRLPLEAIIREAVTPHEDRGKSILITVSEEVDFPQHQPVIEYRPEIVHGLRNLVQNAVDFARSQVVIETRWTDDTVMLRVGDDGPGFPPSSLGRLGEPFLKRRKATDAQKNRPGYEGMGLGLFIAKTLLERTGATVFFSNGSGLSAAEGQTGATVLVEWPRDRVDPIRDRGLGPLGQNTHIEI